MWCSKVCSCSPHTALSVCAKTWHNLLGHLNLSNVKILAKKGSVKLFKFSFSSCDTCQRAKLTRPPFSSSFPHCTSVLSRIHSGVVGPFPVSVGGACYNVSFSDDHSCYAVIFSVKHKSDIFHCFLNYKARVENLFSSKIKTVGCIPSVNSIKVLHCDRGGEYSSDTFGQFLVQHGIVLEPGPAHTPQRNGLAEGFNRILVERVRCNIHTCTFLNRQRVSDHTGPGTDRAGPENASRCF